MVVRRAAIGPHSVDTRVPVSKKGNKLNKAISQAMTVRGKGTKFIATQKLPDARVARRVTKVAFQQFLAAAKAA